MLDGNHSKGRQNGEETAEEEEEEVVGLAVEEPPTQVSKALLHRFMPADQVSCSAALQLNIKTQM